MGGIGVGVGVTLVALVLGSVAAYALVRLRMPFRQGLLVGILGTRMIPEISLVIPMYLFATRFGLFNTPLILVIFWVYFVMPIFTGRSMDPSAFSGGRAPRAKAAPLTPTRGMSTQASAMLVPAISQVHTAWNRSTPAPFRNIASGALTPVIAAHAARPTRSDRGATTRGPTHQCRIAFPKKMSTRPHAAFSARPTVSVFLTMRFTHGTSPRASAMPTARTSLRRTRAMRPRQTR